MMKILMLTPHNNHPQVHTHSETDVSQNNSTATAASAVLLLNNSTSENHR
jgi:hypothetical protein